MRFSITGPGRHLNLRSYPKADIAERGQNVRLVPGSDIAARYSITPSGWLVCFAVEVPHAFFHHMQTVEKFLLVTQKAARHHRLFGLAQDRRTVLRQPAYPLTRPHDLCRRPG